MNLRLLLSALLLMLINSLFAQTQIDGAFPFQSDSNKKYTLIVPSSYNVSSPTKVMLGLHPFNTSRWSGETWCEYLTEFAENNNLLLVCPDGGADGKIDDPIDTAFTSVLLDSVGIWFQIQSDKVYAMGFSWGGRTTYTYGLSNTDRLHGFMPIGAAISGVNIDAIAPNAEGQPFYFIHGGNDNPAYNLFPYKELVEEHGAITNSKVLPGVGHTIDFNNNIAILTEAFIWIDSINCDTTTATGFGQVLLVDENKFQVFPNPLFEGQDIQISIDGFSNQDLELSIFNTSGQIIKSQKLNFPTGQQEVFSIKTEGWKKGIYYLVLEVEKGRISSKTLVIR